jgi:hypothetical protein
MNAGRRSGGAAALFLIKPPMDTFDIAAAYTAVAGPIHCRERILIIICTPQDVAKPLGALIKRAFFFFH